MAHDKKREANLLLSFSLIICTYNSPSLHQSIVQPHLHLTQMGLSLYI